MRSADLMTAVLASSPDDWMPPPDVISKALGHPRVSTTSIDLDPISPQAVVDALRNRTWGGISAAAAAK